MSNLSNQQINSSFSGLLQVPGGITSTLKTVQDGNGNPTGLSISSTSAGGITVSTFRPSINTVPITGTVNRTINDGFGDFISVKDFGAIGDGVTDDAPAIQNAVNYACTGTSKTVYIPAGSYLLKSSIVFPGGSYCAFVGESNVFYNSSLIQGFAGHMLVLGSATSAASPRIENIVIQGNKTTYPGNYHGIYQTTTGAANTAFQTLRNVIVRDMGGVGIYMDYAFYCNFHDVTCAYNKAGGMRIGGGAGNNMTVCTQNNLGYGVYFGAIGSFCQFFLEGDCIDNDPAGLNLSNYELNLIGGGNRIGGVATTSALNSKTGINVSGANNLISLSIDGTFTSPILNFNSGAECNWITGNLGNSQTFFTGDAASINRMMCQGDAGSFRSTSTGERIFALGNSSSLYAAKGLHVGFDPTTNISFIDSTFPGTGNYELRMTGSKINLYGNLATNQTASSGLSTPATVNNKLPIYNNAGTLVGYIPIFTTL